MPARSVAAGARSISMSPSRRRKWTTASPGRASGRSTVCSMNFEVSPRWCAIHATHMTPDETRAAGAKRRRRRPLPDDRSQSRRRHLPGRPFLMQAAPSPSAPTAISASARPRICASSNIRSVCATAPAMRWPAAPDNRPAAPSSMPRSRAARRPMAQPVGALAPGNRADIVVLDADHPALIGRRATRCSTPGSSPAAMLACAMSSSPASHVVKDRRHVDEERDPRAISAPRSRGSRSKGIMTAHHRRSAARLSMTSAQALAGPISVELAADGAGGGQAQRRDGRAAHRQGRCDLWRQYRLRQARQAAHRRRRSLAACRSISCARMRRASARRSTAADRAR